MSIFKKDSSSKIGKRVADFKAQLLSVEKQLQEKESKIEATVAAGGDTDRLFIEACVIRGNIESRRIILERMEQEYSRVMIREEHAVKVAELDRFEKLLEKGIASLDNGFKDFVEAGKDLLIKEGALNGKFCQLLEIPAPAGVNFMRLLNVDFGRIILALTVRLPANTPAAAIATASAEITYNLSSIRNTMRSY